MASTGVFTRKRRVKFVEKTAGQVGDGTAYPMLVTMAQLAELMHRVRDARWVSGTATTSDGTLESVVTFTTVTPPTAKVEFELQAGNIDSAYTRRGYVAETNDIAPDEPMNAYDGSFFSTVDYLTVGGTNGEPTESLAYREAITERSILANGFPISAPTESGYYEALATLDSYLLSSPNDKFKTGFSFFGTSWTDGFVEPTIYAPFSTWDDLTVSGSAVPYLGGMVVISFSGEVAWVDLNSSGSPIDPLNELYVAVFFGVRNSFDGNTGNYSHSSNLSMLYSPTSGKLADLKLKLSGVGDYLTAAIYGWNDYQGGSGATATATDWIFEATEWWPYAKIGGPVWDSGTGAEL